MVDPTEAARKITRVRKAGPPLSLLPAVTPRTPALRGTADQSEEAFVATLSRLGYRMHGRTEALVDVTFYDSQDGVLYRRGMSLLEAHDPFARFVVDGSEQRLVSALTAQEQSDLFRGRPEIPYVRLVGSRTQWHALGFSAGSVEVSLFRLRCSAPLRADQAAALTFVTVSPAGSIGGSYLTRLLIESAAFRSVESTLLELALGTVDSPPPGAPLPEAFRIQSADTLNEAAAKVVGAQAYKMRANLEGARHDLDPEYVHDLRVATRRARFGLKLFAKAVGSERVSQLRIELAWLAQLLGAVRDLDVLQHNLVEQMAQIEAEESFRDSVLDLLASQRMEAVQLLVAGLATGRCERLIEALEVPFAIDAVETINLERFASKRIAKAVARIVNATSRRPDDIAPAELHALRILVKRLRYTCEFFQPLFGPVTTGLVGELTSFQDSLGTVQDASVSIENLHGLSRSWGAMAGKPSFALSLGALIQVQRDRRRVERERFLSQWDHFRNLISSWSGG